jgi:hypothetical protein
MTRARTLVLLLSLVALLGLSACGGQEEVDPGGFQTENAQVAETEGIYVDVDELKYQVQISRQLNPLLAADRDFFQGIAPADRELESDEVWFGLWMRVENDTEEPIRSVQDFEIHDTQENVYRPVSFGRENVWAYRSTVVPGEKLYPTSETPAAERQPFGALILFKIRRFSLDNRPLELIFRSPESGREAIVNLDV